MTDNEKQAIKEFVDKQAAFRREYLNFETESKLQLLLSQLDLFKVISALVVALIGIFLFNHPDVNGTFLFASLTVAIIVFILCVSYARETPDIQDKSNRDTREELFKKTEEDIEIAMKALRENNFQIFLDQGITRLQEPEVKPPLNYTGEIIVLFLYLAIGFLIYSFAALKYHFDFFSIQSSLLLIISIVLAFTDWASRLLAKLSYYLDKIRIFLKQRDNRSDL